MEILVNQEPLSYTLESEESLGDVIDGLARWLSNEQYAITAIDVDSRSLPIHDRSRWEEVEVGTVNRLSVEAFPLTHVQQTTLAALGEYCVLLQHAIDEQDVNALGELAEELPYVRNRLQEFFPALVSADPNDKILHDETLETGQLPHSDARVRLSTQLSSIAAIIESRLREFQNPARELGLTLGQLVACSAPLVEVPIQLQTGDESVAMGTVVRFTELLSRIIRLLPMLKESDLDTNLIGQFALDLTPFLGQLQEAFEVQDGVLIGDLLEYEIAPRLSQLPSLIPDFQTTGEESERE
jgi:hypothetical protein